LSDLGVVCCVVILLAYTLTQGHLAPCPWLTMCETIVSLSSARVCESVSVCVCLRTLTHLELSHTGTHSFVVDFRTGAQQSQTVFTHTKIAYRPTYTHPYRRALCVCSRIDLCVYAEISMCV